MTNPYGMSRQVLRSPTGLPCNPPPLAHIGLEIRRYHDRSQVRPLLCVSRQHGRANGIDHGVSHLRSAAIDALHAVAAAQWLWRGGAPAIPCTLAVEVNAIS